MLCAVLVCCCGCNWNPFVKHPYLYGDSVWVCENPKITYVVEMKYDDEQEMDMPQTYAVTNVDGKEILFDFDYLYENIIAYEVSDSDLERWSSLGVSNELVPGRRCVVKIKHGVGLLIRSN